MKKLVLFFLVLFSGFVFAACPGLTIGITSPLSNSSLGIGQSFTFTANLIDFGNPDCATDVEFQYDDGLGTGVFIQIPDNTFPPGAYNFESTANNTSYPVTLSGSSSIESVTITCNAVGTYVLRVFSNTDSVSSLTRTIYCVASAPPTGYFLVPAFTSVLYKKNNGTGAPDPFTYTINWEASDAEGDALDYDVKVKKDGVLYDSALGLVAKTYGASISDYGEFTFEVNIKETSGGGNTTAIYSESLFVKDRNFSTLSMVDLNLFPETIYGDDSIDVNIVVRNYSPDSVDIDVLFFNENFLPDPHEDNKQNISAYSKEKFSMHQEFAGLQPGDYNVRVVVKEYFAGTTTLRNQITSYAYFIVLEPTKPVSMPETSLIAVIMISLIVLLITRK